jgi:hypothetical protein
LIEQCTITFLHIPRLRCSHIGIKWTLISWIKSKTRHGEITLRLRLRRGSGVIMDRLGFKGKFFRVWIGILVYLYILVSYPFINFVPIVRSPNGWFTDQIIYPTKIWQFIKQVGRLDFFPLWYISYVKEENPGNEIAIGYWYFWS